MNNSEIKAWCEENDIEFTAFTQWHLRLRDTDLDIKIDLWPSKKKCKRNGDDVCGYYDLKMLLHDTFIVPATALDKPQAKDVNPVVTLFDLYASHALQGWIASHSFPDTEQRQNTCAHDCCAIATTMLKVRDQYLTSK